MNSLNQGVPISTPSHILGRKKYVLALFYARYSLVDLNESSVFTTKCRNEWTNYIKKKYRTKLFQAYILSAAKTCREGYELISKS